LVITLVVCVRRFWFPEFFISGPGLGAAAPPFCEQVHQSSVEIAGLGAFRVPEFFLPFEAVMPGHQYVTLGFFGKITYAKIDPTERALWLSFGGHVTPSICVPWQLIPEFYYRFKINQLSDLAGSNALIVGMLKVSQKGQWHVVLHDIHYVAVDLVRG
jgi:hypothetical protein